MSYKYPNVDLNLKLREGDELVVPPFMAQLVDAIAVKYPAWLLKVTGVSRPSDGKVNADSFVVYDNSNPRKIVGKIGFTRRYHQNRGTELVYYIECQRLAHARERGSDLRTKELKVAMRAVKEFFTPPPLPERLDEINSDANDFLRGLRGMYAQSINSSRNSTYPLMQRFVRDNWELFISTLAPADRAEIDNLSELEANQTELLWLSSALSDGKVLTVLIDNDKYVVRYGGEISVWESEELPDEVRQRIGMLKLADVHVVIENTGVKTPKGFIVVAPDGFSFKQQES